MGEANRRKALYEATRLLSRRLLDHGRLVDAGWLLMQNHYLPDNATAEEIARARDCFFAGAQHLFFSLMGGLDDGVEETREDMRRMAMLDSELETFAADFASRHPQTPDLFREMKGAVKQ